MIDPVLKKFGMFQAQKSVNSLKSLNNTGPVSHRTPRKSKNSDKKQLNLAHSVVHTHKQSNPSIRSIRSTNREDHVLEECFSQLKLKSQKQAPPNKLQKIKAFLSSHYRKNCPIHINNGNKIKYLCLEQACSDNLGCAQCFLHKHANHQKAQIGACVRQLQQLDIMMKNSYQIIISQKTVLKSQFIRKIELEIENMCQQFSRNLQFLKNKALKQLDDNLFCKYQQLQILNTIRRTQNQKITHSQLMAELLKLDIKGIQRDLYAQLKQLSMEKSNFQPIIKLFEQMNGALGHFMAQFKKCFPKIHRVKSDSFDSSKINESSPIKLQARFSTLNQFKNKPEDLMSQYKHGTQQSI